MIRPGITVPCEQCWVRSSLLILHAAACGPSLPVGRLDFLAQAPIATGVQPPDSWLGLGPGLGPCALASQKSRRAPQTGSKATHSSAGYETSRPGTSGMKPQAGSFTPSPVVRHARKGRSGGTNGSLSARRQPHPSCGAHELQSSALCKVVSVWRTRLACFGLDPGWAS